MKEISVKLQTAGSEILSEATKKYIDITTFHTQRTENFPIHLS